MSWNSKLQKKLDSETPLNPKDDDSYFKVIRFEYTCIMESETSYWGILNERFYSLVYTRTLQGNFNFQ